MRIIFVRHGEPDYEHDCLTNEGRRQAKAAAGRLLREGITEIYTSPCGRASETASFTAERLGLPVVTLDYLREITWGGDEIPHKGHPWTLGDEMMEEGFDFRAQDWREHPFFHKNAAKECFGKVTAAFDAFLAEQGYIHEEHRFLCKGGTDKTMAVFWHGGSGACVLSHLLDIPFPYVLSVMPYGFTSITVLRFAVKEGEYVFPRLELFNDCAHTEQAAGEVLLQQEA